MAIPKSKISKVRDLFMEAIKMHMPQAAIGIIKDDDRLAKPTRKWSYYDKTYNVVDYVVSVLVGTDRSCACREKGLLARSERDTYEAILQHLADSGYKTVAEHSIEVDRILDDEDVASVDYITSVENRLGMRFMFTDNLDGTTNNELIRNMTPDVAEFMLARFEGKEGTKALLEMASSKPYDTI